MAPNKTDGNDADGLTHLAEVGFYRELRVKGFDSTLTRTLVAARTDWCGSQPSSPTRSAA
jgi:transposase